MVRFGLGGVTGMPPTVLGAVGEIVGGADGDSVDAVPDTGGASVVPGEVIDG